MSRFRGSPTIFSSIVARYKSVHSNLPSGTTLISDMIRYIAVALVSQATYRLDMRMFFFKITNADN